MFLLTEWFGTFLVDGGRIQSGKDFPREPAQLALRLQALQRGEILEEERVLAGEAGPVQVTERRLLPLPGTKLASSTPTVRDAAPERGFDRELFRQAVLELARAQTREALAGRDQHVVQAVQAIDDLADAANLVAERLREWHGLHFPEGERVIARHEELATLVSQHVTREAMLAKSPHLKLERESMGAGLAGEEAQALRGFAKALSTLYAQRADLEAYLDRAMPGVAPNVTKLVGPSIAARLLFHAGGLQELARLPSGTVQTLGAEKALFRHLKEGTKPPKHGVLFQHTLIHRAPFAQRGSLARALAGAVSIAARADAITHNDVAERLQRGLDKRVGTIRTTPRKPGAGRRPASERGAYAEPSRGTTRGPPSAGTGKRRKLTSRDKGGKR